MTNELAPAREIDVFSKEKIKKAARDIVPRRGVRATQREFAARRTKAFKRARKAVDSERCRALFINVMGWIEEKHRGTEKDAVIGVAEVAMTPWPGGVRGFASFSLVITAQTVARI